MPAEQASSLRVCIVAENASFRFGGEASLPLHYFSRLRARGIETWLVVHSRTRAELETLFPDDQGRIQYIPDMWFHKLIWKTSRFLPRRVAEATLGMLMLLINQLIQRSMVRQIVGDHKIDIIHQPIPVSPKAPSFISGLSVPVIIGPMNGGMDFPAAFRGAESRFTRVTVALGRSSANFVNRIIAGKKNAAILLVANQRTRLALPSCVRGQIIELPENGVDLRVWQTAASSSSADARFLFVGRLVDWKRLDLVIHAIAATRGAELEVIGDGPMRPAWAALAGQLGVAARVHFIGWLPQPECAIRLQNATALLLPSVYECGGAVVLEAMATGAPVVATDWGGPADYLDSSCGFLIDPTNPETITRGFESAMKKLMNDPDLRQALGSAGRQRVQQQYDWDQKIDRILAIYEQAIDEQAARASRR